MRLVLLALCVGLILGIASLATALRAQTGAALALTGNVSSAAEGPMEGVLVTAQRDGSSISITVVSDEHGTYRFPASYLAPGAYGLRIRAVGYDLAGPERATVGTMTTRSDLRLVPTQHLEDQLTDAEWMVSMPGTDDQKAMLFGCNGCHTLQRVVDSYHTAADFQNNVLPRMESYANDSFWLKPQMFPNVRNLGRIPDGLAAYLASINQSQGPRTWPLKTFARLHGPSTHVIITAYGLPSRLSQPHDVIGSPDGTIWYSDFGQQFLGNLDPRTGKVVQYPIPENKPGYITGSLQLDRDRDGYFWLGNMYQGQIDRFDPRTKTFTRFPMPPGPHPEYTQESMVNPTHDSVDGEVWTVNSDSHTFWRLDTKTGKWQGFGPFTYPNSKEPFTTYGIPSDANNTLWLLDFGGGAIGHLDTATKTIKVVATPTKLSRPRRGHYDDRTGMLWFGEYGGNAIGVYDTKRDNGVVKEYPVPTPWDQPYDAVADKNGNVWTGSMWSDRISRLDPSTGRFVVYQLPIETNIRRVWVDNKTNPVTFWVGSNHEATILRLQTTN